MFCNFCGAQNPDGSNFCSKCGKVLNTKINFTSDEPTKYNLSIFRVSQTYVINPPINISITHNNHTEELSIANGQNISLSLEKGDYDFLFYQSFRKKAIHVYMDRDHSITVKWNRITGAIELSLK